MTGVEWRPPMRQDQPAPDRDLLGRLHNAEIFCTPRPKALSGRSDDDCAPSLWKLAPQRGGRRLALHKTDGKGPWRGVFLASEIRHDGHQGGVFLEELGQNGEGRPFCGLIIGHGESSGGVYSTGAFAIGPRQAPAAVESLDARADLARWGRPHGRLAVRCCWRAALPSRIAGLVDRRCGPEFYRGGYWPCFKPMRQKQTLAEGGAGRTAVRL